MSIYDAVLSQGTEPEAKPKRVTDETLEDALESMLDGGPAPFPSPMLNLADAMRVSIFRWKAAVEAGAPQWVTDKFIEWAKRVNELAASPKGAEPEPGCAPELASIPPSTADNHGTEIQPVASNATPVEYVDREELRKRYPVPSTTEAVRAERVFTLLPVEELGEGSVVFPEPVKPPPPARASFEGVDRPAGNIAPLTEESLRARIADTSRRPPQQVVVMHPDLLSMVEADESARASSPSIFPEDYKVTDTVQDVGANIKLAIKLRREQMLTEDMCLTLVSNLAERIPKPAKGEP